MIRSAAIGCCLVLCATLGWSQTNVPGGAVPNSKHYRDSGVGNATGRNGAAVMTARALLGKDSNTTIELTTGTLDSSTTPPGSFDHVQFKSFSQAGNPLYTQNLSPGTATGYYTFTSPSLYRAEQVQLQGNITGIDQNRTDVVTVVETVKLRPDLTVESLQFPSSAMVNQMVNVSANIVELNGDAGANTTCQLLIDGTLADSTPQPIWVDAGGSVSCEFSYRFTAAGSHSIDVVAANATPADWDTSNNTASGTINITDTTPFQHAGGSFSDTNGGFPYVSTSSEEIWLNGTIVENYSNSFGNSGEEQASLASFSSGGCGSNSPGFQFPVNITYAEMMDGNPVYGYSDDGVSGYNSIQGVSGSMCGTDVTSGDFAEQHAVNYASDHSEYVNSVQVIDASGNMVYSYKQVDIQRTAGTVTYFSSGYSCYWWSSSDYPCSDPPNGYYIWNYGGTSTYGTLVPVGSTWTPSLVIRDAAGNGYSGSISVGLTATQHTHSAPTTCYESGPDPWGYTYQFCNGEDETYTITSGTGYQ